MLFEGFETFDVDTGGARVHGVATPSADLPPVTGTRPVLLLHGFPETHAMWHRVGPALAADGHRVVATDLRGYGSSSRPPAGADHAGYSFRAMAADQVAVMDTLGHRRFAVVAHDRGARVAHRMALDHPDRVERLVLLDILPTAYVYSHVDRALATAYYHWFFFLQPEPLPERLIGADPAHYLRSLLTGWGSGRPAHYDPEAYEDYERCFSDPDARHAMLEDYRAGASIDLDHDAEGGSIDAPTLVLWGAEGVVARNAEDPLEVWRRAGRDVTGGAVAGAGHFLVEEQPEAVLAGLRPFLSARPAPGGPGDPGDRHRAGPAAG